MVYMRTQSMANCGPKRNSCTRVDAKGSLPGCQGDSFNCTLAYSIRHITSLFHIFHFAMWGQFQLHFSWFPYLYMFSGNCLFPLYPCSVHGVCSQSSLAVRNENRDWGRSTMGTVSIVPKHSSTPHSSLFLVGIVFYLGCASSTSSVPYICNIGLFLFCQVQ